jgi:hypothetical protein
MNISNPCRRKNGSSNQSFQKQNSELASENQKSQRNIFLGETMNDYVQGIN